MQEDPGGLSYLTVYAYGALDDLTTVNQNGRTRTFIYDSFGRLGQAVNPETGAISYGYDADGNLMAKSDQRGASILYGYDALNRMTSKSYGAANGQVGPPPLVSYVYDAAILYGKGRLAAVSNGVKVNYLAYDALGRVLGSNQQIEGQTYPFSYSYNLAGSVTSEL